MIKINEVEIKKQSWRRQDVEVPRRTGTSENGMNIIINKEDGYVNGSLLAEQTGMSLHGFFKLDHIKETTEHIQVLTGNKAKYKGESPWDNVKGMYVHPFLALEMVAIKKCEDSDYEEYYEFLKTSIIEFLENNQDLKEQYNFIEEFHG